MMRSAVGVGPGWLRGGRRSGAARARGWWPGGIEGLEPRQVLATARPGLAALLAASAAPAPARPNPGTIAVPGGGDVHLFVAAGAAAGADEVGLFFVDGPDGRITHRVDGDPFGAPILDAQGRPQFSFPGDADYVDWALRAANRVSAPFTGTGDAIVTDPWDGSVAFYVVHGGTAADVEAADPADRPAVSLSVPIPGRRGDFRTATPRDPGYRAGLLQYVVTAPGADTGLTLGVNAVPYVAGMDYSVFNTGADFDGAPEGFEADLPGGDPANRGFGLLAAGRNMAHPGQPLTIDGLSLDGGETWLTLDRGSGRAASRTVADPALHGTLTITAGGGIRFEPDAADPFWASVPGDAEPIVEFQYRATDGIDTTTAWATITHGFVQLGGAPDAGHSGRRMYLLGGGGDDAPYEAASRAFFQDGGAGGDIVLIRQGGVERRDEAAYVADVLAQGRFRSLTALNLTLRSQANDPRIARILRGADALDLGGGAQSLYHAVLAGTRAGAAVRGAAAGSTAIGGTSAGTAVQGQRMYLDLPWDSVTSQFATVAPRSPRLRVVPQGPGRFPLGPLSGTAAAPLFNLITDTHFAPRDRMGRLIAFTAHGGPSPRGLGIDTGTAALVTPGGRSWNFAVFGEGHAYLLTRRVGPTQTPGGRLNSVVNVFRLDPTGADGARPLRAIQSGTPSYQLTVWGGALFGNQAGGGIY